MKKVKIIVFFVCISLQTLAQTDTLNAQKDTNKVSIQKLKVVEIDTNQKKEIKKKETLPKNTTVALDSTTQENVHIPLKATLYSIVLPGLGQAYNKKYWKIPIIYGLGATLGYFIAWNNTLYSDYRTSFLIKSTNIGDANDPYPLLGLESVRVRKNRFKRDRDFLIILSCALYLLNIVDATVDAHLKDFDVNDNLSINFEPSIQNIDNHTFMSFQMNLNFR